MAAEVRRASGIRLRTTAAATLVVALALALGSVALVLVMRASMLDQLVASGEIRAESLAAMARDDTLGVTTVPRADDDDEPDEVIEVRRSDGSLVASSQHELALPRSAVDADGETIRVDGERYVVVTERVGDQVIVVALSTEEVDDATEAVLGPLVVGVPLLLLVVAATTWVVVGRALAPVERIRAEVATITDSRLDRRVPEPASRDEIGRLAATMNSMLERLERGRDAQRRFVSDASHELRSPLATLRQAAEVSQAHPDAFEPGELADTVAEESVRMQHLVEQLLLLTRVDEGRVGSVDEIDLDDLVLAEAERLRRTGTSVDTSAVVPVRLRGQRLAWAQMLRNLADNAARHAAEGVAFSVREVGGRVEVLVDDDGAGVPQADRDRIFDRFVRLDEARSRDAGGSGLGLAIVRELARAAGGEVRVEDSPTGGARFVLSVPRT